jgi:hypothetical protein
MAISKCVFTVTAATGFGFPMTEEQKDGLSVLPVSDPNNLLFLSPNRTGLKYPIPNGSRSYNAFGLKVEPECPLLNKKVNEVIFPLVRLLSSFMVNIDTEELLRNEINKEYLMQQFILSKDTSKFPHIVTESCANCEAENCTNSIRNLVEYSRINPNSFYSTLTKLVAYFMNSQGRRASLLVPEHNEPLLIGQFKF